MKKLLLPLLIFLLYTQFAKAQSNLVLQTPLSYIAGNGTENVFIGRNAGNLNGSGSYNSFLGSLAGSKNTTGRTNLFLGAYSGFSNTTGSDNMFLGTYSGYSNSTGEYNAFLGSSSGYFNTTGVSNSFLGSQAGYYNSTGNNNLFLGTLSGYNNSTGNDNAFIGASSGYSNKGSQNVFVGTSAGKGNTTGNNNVALGYLSGFGSAGLTNAIAIGTQAYVTTSNSLVMGSISGINGATASTNVGIGTTAPTARLEINSNVANTSGLKLTSLKSSSTAVTANGKALSVDASGNVILVTAGGSGTTYTGGTGIGISGTTIAATNTSAIWNANLIQGKAISATTPTTGQVLQWNGSAWTATTLQAGNTNYWTLNANNISNNNVNGVIIGTGITSTPVGYKLYVSDGILTEKLRIASKTNPIKWADYVFEKNYELKSIAEVEKYIAENKHLPNIPSAKEVAQDGFDIAEMNTKLLEKVEELTLHIINLNNQMIKVNKKLYALKKKNLSKRK